MPANLQPLIDEMTRAATLEDAAVALINGIPAQIQTAVDAAIAGGATSDQLKPVTDALAVITAKDDALAAALFANTPPATKAL